MHSKTRTYAQYIFIKCVYTRVIILLRRRRHVVYYVVVRVLVNDFTLLYS